jgi:hypothetical protein
LLKVEMAGFGTKNPTHLFLVSGLSACCGELVTLPIDMIKVRYNTLHASDNKVRQQIYGTRKSDKLTSCGPSILQTLRRIVQETGNFNQYLNVPDISQDSLACGGELHQLFYGS